VRSGTGWWRARPDPKRTRSVRSAPNGSAARRGSPSAPSRCCGRTTRRFSIGRESCCPTPTPPPLGCSRSRRRSRSPAGRPTWRSSIGTSMGRMPTTT
jgi:hypothetical protein